MDLLILLPFFKEYIHFGYWKTERIKLLLHFEHYITAGVHLTRQGLIFILRILYSYPQNREYTLEHWIDLANAHFDRMDKGCKSGKHCVEPYNGRGERAGIQLGWRVVLPSKFSAKVPLKYFSFTKFGSNQDALCEAINYRDSVIESHLNTLNSSYID